jgi:hypothetical protein
MARLDQILVERRLRDLVVPIPGFDGVPGRAIQAICRKTVLSDCARRLYANGSTVREDKLNSNCKITPPDHPVQGLWI